MTLWLLHYPQAPKGLIRLGKWLKRIDVQMIMYLIPSFGSGWGVGFFLLRPTRWLLQRDLGVIGFPVTVGYTVKDVIRPFFLEVVS